jgi:hypothetical protein
MGNKYVHNKRSRANHKLALTLAVLAAVVIIGGGIGALAWYHNRQPDKNAAEGKAILVPQKSKKQPKLNIVEPNFKMQLPGDWKQTPPPKSDPNHPLVWAGTSKTDNARSLAVYVDSIPPKLPVNRELPLTVHGNQLSYGQMSENCSDFTPGGTENAGQAEKLQPKKSVWQGVNFICDLPRVIDNQIGTGEAGQPVNTVTVSGAKSGKHSYFFLFTDRTGQPNYSAFYHALDSFRAK